MSDIDARLGELREQKAEYINIDPRPLEDGDYAVVALESLAGIEGDPVKTDEMVLEVGGADTLPEFTENLRGVTPGEEREISTSPIPKITVRSVWPAKRSPSAPLSRASARRNSPS